MVKPTLRIISPITRTQLMLTVTEFGDKVNGGVKHEEQSGIKQEFIEENGFKNEPGQTPSQYIHIYEKPGQKYPAKFTESYNLIVDLRNKIIAPVDTIGCERIPLAIDPSMAPRMFRFQLLVSLMLSSQTKDEVTHAAVAAMHHHFEGGLSLEAILGASEKEIDGLICKVGFHNRKAGYLKKAADMLATNYGGDIPKLIEEIVALPGVGPKMGYLLLQVAWGISLGIGVDVHLHRIANNLGWTKSTNPEGTRKQLQTFVPQEYWKEINPLVVGFGQSVCLPKAPLCDICLILGLCPKVNRKLKGKEIDEERKKKILSGRGDISRVFDW